MKKSKTLERFQCPKCEKEYLLPIHHIKKVKGRPRICNDCKKSKSPPKFRNNVEENCGNCVHFNTLSDNKFWGKCSLNRKNEFDLEPEEREGLVYFRDYCGSFEEEE